MTIVRSGDTSILFRAVLFDGANAKIIAGATTLRLWRVVSSTGALETYDFNDDTFKAGAITTPTVAMTHRQAENSTYDTGVWTYRHANLAGFTEAYIGEKYFAEVSHASLVRPITLEFQYGDLEGDESDYLPIIRGRNTAAGGNVAYITLDASASAVDNFYQGLYVTIIGGTGIRQTRRIEHYTQADKRAYVTPAFSTAPDATSIFLVHGVPSGRLLYEHAGLAQAGAAGSITLATTASASANIYKGMFVRIVAGTGTGQCRYINDYTAGRVASVTPNWVTNPDATSVYELLPSESVWDELMSQHVTALTTGGNLDALGTAIDARANNPNLNALLGVADVAGHDVPYENWEESNAAHVVAGSVGLHLNALGAAIAARAFNSNLNALLGVPDTALTDTVAGQVWQELAVAHNTAGTMGEIMNNIAAAGFPSVATISDGVWDELLAGHVLPGSSGLMLGALDLTTRANNPTLNALLGVSDLPGYTIAETVWFANANLYVTADCTGLCLASLGLAISQRAFNPTLNALLGVPAVAGANIAETIWDEVINAATHNVADSAGRRLWTIDDRTEAGGTGDLQYILAQVTKIDQGACDSPATADSLADKLDDLAAVVAIIDRDIITSCNIEGNNLRIEAAVEQYGLVQTAPWDQCVAQIFDEGNAIVANIGAGDFGAITARGFFQFTWSPHTLVAGRTYQIQIAVTDTGGPTTIQTTKLIKVTNV